MKQSIQNEKKEGQSKKKRKSRPSVYSTIIALQQDQGEHAKIPTTFVPLTPDKLRVDSKGIDVLFGLFFIMWEDMPSPRTYKIRLAERVSFRGEYIGSFLLYDDHEQALIDY